MFVQWVHNQFDDTAMFNRPGVAGAVLQTPLSLINYTPSVSDPLRMKTRRGRPR